MARLRDPETGCEWDIKQTFRSIAPYTIEEAYEVADAIERDDIDDLRDELGDLLLQVVFHAQMADDQGLFDFADVAKGIADKMIRRHPHVFGELAFENEEQQRAHWELLKHQERSQKSPQDTSAIADVALALPALTRAEKIQKRAARVGFDWQQLDPVINKIDEELAELRVAISSADSITNEAIEDELGDLLFAATNTARHLKIDPEQALKKATAKFERRFRFIEASARAEGRNLNELNTEELDRYWVQAKKSV